MATYAIGDLQGCLEPLQRLLEQIEFSPQDTLWFCGDLVNRGPDSLATLRFVKALGKQAVVVLGNHDLHLLALHHGICPGKRTDTLDDILSAPDRTQLLGWLQHQPLLHHDSQLGYTMVHAGIPPSWSIKKARRLAREVEYALRSRELAKGFFEHMYGNAPARWHKSLEGWERLRVITNYLTRMRFCTADETLDFAAKGGLDTQPPGYLPWYAWPNRKAVNNDVLFGHWAALQGQVDAAHVYALDTGCVWGGQLTAMRLEDRRFFHTQGLSTAG